MGSCCSFLAGVLAPAKNFCMNTAGAAYFTAISSFFASLTKLKVAEAVQGMLRGPKKPRSPSTSDTFQAQGMTRVVNIRELGPAPGDIREGRTPHLHSPLAIETSIQRFFHFPLSLRLLCHGRQSQLSPQGQAAGRKPHTSASPRVVKSSSHPKSEKALGR